jgi:hypothetical protein
MKSLGLRCVEVAENLFWVRENPLGSNSGPEIARFFAPCTRGDTETKLGLKSGNWCAAFACYCMKKALAEGEPEPHGYRAGVVEIVADVSRKDEYYKSKWHPVSQVRNGTFSPAVGDLAIYDRSVTGRPETSWWRHVNRVTSYRGSTYTAIGGNENNGVRLASYDIEEQKLLGFIAYPRPPVEVQRAHIPSPEEHIFTPEERQEIWNNVALCLDELSRKIYER